MDDEIFPRHFEAWKKCITEKCKIELTQSYVNERIAVLSDPLSQERKRFEETFGAHWTSTILKYFKQAKDS